MTKKAANPADAFIGSRVRIRRMLIGMSQERLGELLDLTFQQVQKYEKGVNRIGAGRLYDVARILGVPITYFYEGLDQPEEVEVAGLSPEARGVALIIDQFADEPRQRVAKAIRNLLRDWLPSIRGGAVAEQQSGEGPHAIQ
jgi:transcriptional regulator with XRE-family HTH domain